MRFLNKQISLTIALIFVLNPSVFGERWSRQLQHDSPASVNDWVPIKSGKSISFGEDLQAAAQTNFQFFSEPLNNRFNLQQSHPAHPNSAPSEINSFSSQNAPPFQYFNQQQKQRTVQNFGGPINNKPAAEALVQNPPPFQFMQEIQRGPHVHHYQSQPIPKNLQNFPQGQSIPPFQQLSGQHRAPQFQNLPPPPQFQPAPAPPQFQPLQGEQQPQSEENVQLLYVPYDSLYPNQQQQHQQQQQREPSFVEKNPNRFNILNQPVSASLINDFYSQNEVQEFPTRQPTTKKPSTTRRPTISPVTSSLNPTTPLENLSKQKPHQPPLSMFVAIDKFKGKATEADVLSTLKNSNSIEVMDSITKNSPKVFIGPSGMAPPAGYSKFDLPYLSSIEGTRHERRIEQLPFFVAPLSYRTPPGFSKIPLPAPHVGSVVVNQPPNSIESNESSSFTSDNYYTKQPVFPTVQTSQSVEEPGKKTHQKIRLTSGFNYSPSGNLQLIQNEFTFPTLAPTPTTYSTPRPTYAQTQRPSYATAQRQTFAQTASPSTAETPLTKVAYKQIEEKRNYGHSTHSPTTTRTPVTQTKLDYFPTSPPRSSSRVTTTPEPYVELEEHKTVNEEYFGFEKEKKPKFSFSFGTEVEKEKPAKNFNFRPIPEFDFGDTSGAYETTKKPRTKTTTQATTTETQKSVTRYSYPSTTVSPTTYDYSPTATDFENSDEFAQVNGGSAGNFFEYRSSPKPTTQDYSYNRFNVGNEAYEKENSYTPQRYVQDFSVNEDTQEKERNKKYKPQTYVQDFAVNEDTQEKERNKKYKPQSYVQDFAVKENYGEDAETSTDNTNYNLPSELPSISPQLPGWINSLMDDKWMQKPNVTEQVITTTAAPTTTTTTTRRTINRGSRRPVTTAQRSTATATDSTVERRPSTSRRRPTTYTSRNSEGTTESSFPSRSTAVRGSKVKYNATAEIGGDRSRFRTRNRVPVKKEEQNIDYQRDVLNQNYPTIRPVAVDEVPQKVSEEVHVQQPSEGPTAEHILNDYNIPITGVEVIPLGGNSDDNSEQPENHFPTNHQPAYYENTIETTTRTTTSTTPEAPLPNNHKNSNSFVGLQEPMQVPHHKPVTHRLKSNFNNKHRNIDSFYNTNSQDISTQKLEADDDDISITVPTTRQAPVTEASASESPVPRRTSFPRRRLTVTTTEASTTSSDDTTESSGGRTRGRKENVVVVKKVRGRVRLTTTSTEAPETSKRTVAVRTRSSYNANRNTNRDTTKERGTDANEENKPRFRIRENTPRFRLETQESQWSSRFNQNSFHPIDDEKTKSLKDEIDDEQEIVTAGSDTEKDTYLFNVSASVLPTKPAEKSEDVDETINMISTTEKDIVLGKRIKNEDELGSSFEKFVKDVLEDIEEDTKVESKTEKKPVGGEKKASGRRGVWKKVKVRPADAFETAETQYVGKQLYNTVSNDDKKEGEKRNVFEEHTEVTTVKNVESEPTETIATKETPLEHVFSETTTIEPEVESPKPGMFDEARKALSELFSSEEESDDGVNMEQADEKLEELLDSTTTTQLPSTEESTTVLPTSTVDVTTTEKAEEESIVSKTSKQVQTSQSQKVTGEICYRGRCIKTDEK